MTRLKPVVRIRFALALASALIVVGGLVGWFQHNDQHHRSAAAAPDPFAALDLEDPQSSYLVVRHAVETGGTPRTRELAVAWLDRQMRRQLPLNTDQEKWLIAHLQSNGHASWDSEYRFLFFNSAFNLLQLGGQQEEFSRLMEKLAVDAPEKTMRLYALQHIAVQRASGHLSGPRADEIRATLNALASQPGSPVAGTAIFNLIGWDGPETRPDPQVIALTLKIAEDSSYAVDVRVSALHAAAQASLALARRLAPDTAQPIQLRKAAIANIGRYGNESDSAVLEKLTAENFRIAQAAEPALQTLRKHPSDPKVQEITPF